MRDRVATMKRDAALLEQYVSSRDADAFAALVRDYAGLVYGTCLRITGNAHDAEDVAQQCFLELARGAASVRRVPGWLHRVATRRALDSIRSTAIRRRHESSAIPKTSDTREPTWAEIAPHLDQAVAELPDRLRVPPRSRLQSTITPTRRATSRCRRNPRAPRCGGW